MSTIWEYTNINHFKRMKLGLSMNEYALMDLIFHLSTNPESKHPGWCYASKESIGKNLGLSKRGVLKLLDRLESVGLIERQDVTKYLRTTPKWYKTAYKKSVTDGEQSALEEVNKVHHDGEQSAPKSVNKVHPISNIYINKSNSDKNSENLADEDIDRVTVADQESGNERDDQNIFQQRLEAIKDRSETPSLKRTKQGQHVQKADYIIDRLGTPESMKSSVKRMCRLYPDVIDQALSSSADATVDSKTALFFSKVHELRKQAAPYIKEAPPSPPPDNPAVVLT